MILRACRYLVLICTHFICFAQCPVTTEFGTQWVKGRIGIAGTQAGTQCVGRPVVMTNPNNIGNVKYIYEYRNRTDTTKATSTTSFTYTRTGAYYIVQLGVINGQPSVDCALISVVDTPKPTFTVSDNCAGNTVTLNITRTPLYGQYVVDWGDSSSPQTFSATQQVSHQYQINGNYQIKIRGEGLANLIGCNNTSDPQTFQANLTPLPISNAVVTLQNGQQPLVIATPPSNVLQIKNYIFTQKGIQIVSEKNTFVDSVLNAPAQSVCYQVSYLDSCDKSPATSPIVCTIHLKDQDDLLTWTAASPFAQPVQNYVVERLGGNGQVLRIYNTGTTAQWTIDANDTDQEVYYRVRATAANGQTSISNIIQIIRTVRLMVPDAFSPNNDQINDVFELKGQYIKQASVTIYNKWGEVVFFTKDWRKSWDGNSKEGQPLSVGAYTYRIDYQDSKHQTHQKFGAVYVVR